ncbi:porin [Pedobacter yulinensis]|uniref:Porin n=1 Tax=Pedobacter yulinensis TaxID=2126353 RepID=A0A2T3HGP2_9SPHI|nr:porin [Pedobacter yulinensis]PST81607.1 porin [Pedobacter yulinensis]
MKKFVAIPVLILPLCSLAQNNNAPSSYDPHEIHISGYFQTQFQKASAPGISSFSAGDFGENSDNRFLIRRGRLKVDRADKYTNIVFQIDATQNGFLLMDGFIQIHEPNTRRWMLTAGLFNRPFGHSIAYSSGYRDFPERARVFQTLMPRERDLGAMVTYRPQTALKFLTANLGVVNGSGLTARDYDKRKDIIGSLSFGFDSLAGKKFDLGFGFSGYKGYVRSGTSTYFSRHGDGYMANTAPDVEGTYLKRDYAGADLQLSYRSLLGETIFKTEYIIGYQPGIANSEDVTGPAASQSFTAQPKTDLFLRKFDGYYFWLSHRIAKTKLSALLAYDVYDPNIELAGEEIGQAGNFTTAGDIKYSTLGYGLTYLIGERIKFTLYNEHVVNEDTGLENYTSDIRDDVFTARLQYRW